MTGHNYEVEVVPIGDSLGIILPDTAVRHLEVVVGDEVFITETPTDFQITSITTAMRRGMDENRGVLRRLAGS